MMLKLLVLFVLVPAAELALLIEIGSRIGTLATLALIVLTGVLGSALARRQGLEVLRRMRAETEAGRVPAEPLVDGVLILVAGAFLITPGVLTDVAGFLCLVPAFRSALKRHLRQRFERARREGRLRITLASGRGELFGRDERQAPAERVIDVPARSRPAGDDESEPSDGRRGALPREGE